MQTVPIPLETLRQMIGLSVVLRGHTYAVIEVLDQLPALVLQADDAALTIQADLHGHARRHVTRNTIIPVYAADGGSLHEDFLELDLL
jgi:hypothetical protein